MSNVSIYEKNWIDLVFEGKNKAYGAYQLRQENGKTSLLALLSGITFFFVVIGGGLFLTSFGEVTAATPTNPDVVIQVDSYNYPPDKNDEPKKDIVPPITDNKPTEKVTSKDLVDPVIVKHTDAPDDITKNADLGKSKTEWRRFGWCCRQYQ